MQLLPFNLAAVQISIELLQNEGIKELWK